MLVMERFLEYISIGSSSQRNASQTPSTMHQFDLAHQLAFELREMGLCDAAVDNHCFVYAHLPATPGCEGCPALGLIAHLDTHPDCPGENVRPQIHENYDGNDLCLGTSGLMLQNAQYPNLASLKGQTLITTDGTTLLGADDKAGIAEIMTALSQVIESGRPHGPVSIAFIPDEEIGSGTASFDFAQFGAACAYTVDGWDVGEIEAETFNAMQAVVQLHGVSTHTGRAKGRMVNAQLLALEFAALLPADEIPAKTEGFEGFFHLLCSEGSVEYAKLVYNLRDFTSEGMARRQKLMQQAVDTLNRHWGPQSAQLHFTEQYRNMKEKLAEHPQLVELARSACLAAGITPRMVAGRGGTDGARLTFRGLPCPNLGLGGWGYHSPYEHITVQAMEKVSAILRELIFLFGQTDSI